MSSPAASPRSRRGVALLLFLGLFVVYLANDTVLDEGDAVPSINLPVALLSAGRPSSCYREAQAGEGEVLR